MANAYSPTLPSESPNPSLASAATQVLVRLKAALSQLLSELPGQVGSAADLQRVLGVQQTLAWQVYRVASDVDVVSAASKVPGPFAMKRFLAATRKAGASARAVDATALVFGELQELMNTHAGDRRTFDALMRSLSSGDQDQIDTRLRRAAFQSNSQIWGVHSRSVLAATLFHPGATPDLVNAINIRGRVDTVWLRTGPRVTVFRDRLDADGKHTPSAGAGELGKGNALIHEFSTPGIASRFDRNPGHRYAETHVSAGGVGTTGAATFFVASDLMSGPRQSFDFSLCMQQQTPTELVVYDLLVFDGMFGEIAPRSMVFARPSTDEVSWREWPESDLLPVRTEVRLIGRGAEAVSSTSIPRYPELMRHVCKRLGWNASLFDVYRCQVEYPVQFSSQVLQFDGRPQA